MEKLMQEIEALVKADARQYRARTASAPNRDALKKALEDYLLGSYLVRPGVYTKGGWKYDFSDLIVEWSEAYPPRVRTVRISTSYHVNGYEGVWPNTSPDRGHPAVLIHQDGWIKLTPTGWKLCQQPCGTWANQAIEMLEQEDREVLLSLARLGFQVSVENGHVGLFRQPTGILYVKIRGRPLKKRKRQIGITTVSLEGARPITVPGDWRQTLLPQVSTALLTQL